MKLNLKEQFKQILIEEYERTGKTQEEAEFDFANDIDYINALKMANSLDNLDEIFGEIENIIKEA